ncbi:MAG: hypothetical protein AABW68_04255 [archaeon]
MILLIEDSMVLIHLAKLSLLELSCAHFGNVVISEMVLDETVTTGKEKGFPDSFLIEEMVHKKKVRVEKVINKELIERVNQFNVYGGEAESVALYWQEKADLLACDDDNVRSKKDVLGLSLIGTPVIILQLFRNKLISGEAVIESVSKLRKIGWFHSEVLDRVIREVNK